MKNTFMTVVPPFAFPALSSAQAGHKEFNMTTSPSERHSFEDPDAWYDEYSRIFKFFETHLNSES